MIKTQHVHKLKRLRYRSGNIVFFCVLPDCTKKFNIALSLGKRSICWRCGKEFEMNDYALRLSKPHCEECHKSKKDDSIEYDTQDLKSMEEHVMPRGELSLAERLEQTLRAAKVVADEDEI